MALSIASTVLLNTGVAMPLLGLGTWQLGAAEEAVALIKYALEIGYRHIDTAAAYGNEAEVGRAVRESGLDRHTIFVTSKVWTSDQGYDETLTACRASLSRLGLDVIDCYLIHWPEPGKWQASWRAMETLLRDGLCRSVGVSNFTINHLQELAGFSPLIPAVNQVEFNVFNYRRDLLEYSHAHRIQLEAYSPLARGHKLQHPTLQAIAAHYGKTPAQIALRWCLQHQVVTIPKSAHRERIRENVDLYDFAISPEDMATLDTLDEQYSHIDPAWKARFAG